MSAIIRAQMSRREFAAKHRVERIRKTVGGYGLSFSDGGENEYAFFASPGQGGLCGYAMVWAGIDGGPVRASHGAISLYRDGTHDYEPWALSERRLIALLDTFVDAQVEAYRTGKVSS